MSTSIPRSAEWYAHHAGWYVFPCRLRDKRPITHDGCHAATDDAKAIAGMWRRYPEANVAICAGPSGLVIVDIDGEQGAATLAQLTAAHGEMPITPTVITSSGRHYYFAAPSTPIVSRAHALGAGVDTRAGWAYVVAPPSVHPSGHVYRWAPGRGPHEARVAPLPEWIVEALTVREPVRSSEPVQIDSARVGKYAAAALREECEAVVHAPEGTRNHTLNRAAFCIGQLVGAGVLDRAYALGTLIAAGERAGLPTRESLITTNSGLSAGMAQPRRLTA